MNYNATLLSFRVTKQMQGTHPSSEDNNVTTEIYPDTGSNGLDEGIKIDIVTTTNQGNNYLTLESESIYRIDNYRFSVPIKATDTVAITILSKLSKHSLKLHSERYISMQKAPIFNDTFIPEKTEEQIFSDLTSLYDTREIKREQNN